MFKNSLLFLIVFSYSFLNAQKTDLPFYEKATNGWYKTKTDARLTTEGLLEKHHKDLGLGQWDEFRKYRSETDELGMMHHRFQQFHRGILVEGGILLIHEKEGLVLSFNGQWAKGLNRSTVATFSIEQIIAKALYLLPAQQYMWEDEGAEVMHQRVHQQEDASFYPHPELVWMDLDFSLNGQKLRLAYKMEVQAQIPLFRQQLYLDAQNGEIIQNINLLHGTNVPAIAATKYSGEQQMTTDSVAPGQYRLRETGRGQGIETYDMKGGLIFGQAVDFTDTDNVWDTENAQQDEAATDAHWGAEMTFDYLQTQHNYTGIDNAGMAFISYVHYDETLVNAFWNGSWASFGDGDGNSWTALTSLDVVAHEFAHGITDFTADLIYLNESGALNESFSDILGASVEFWATPELADWRFGEDFHVAGIGFRNMSNPNERGQPDTYFGDFWFNGANDNGGVHTNSGVQNFWFYLLTEGGSGINDFGEPYDVQGLGIDTAAAVAFRSLRYYLSTTSEYVDAREGTLQAAEDLYGVCSDVQIETARAWQAVGFANSIADNDLSIKALLYPTPISCGLTDIEYPLLEIQYHGCATPISAASEIPIAFQLNDGLIILDTITLLANLSAGQPLIHQSDKAIVGLDQMGVHTIKVWTAFELDPTQTNDTLSFEIQNILEQNTDFGSASLPSPKSACFLASEDVILEIGFYGCDSIVAGTELNVFYRLNEGDTITEIAILPHTIYSFETYDHTFSTPLDFTDISGGNYLETWVEFAPDFIPVNDALGAQLITNPKVINNEEVLTFEAGEASLDSIYTTLNRESAVFISSDAAATGSTSIQMTGGDLIASLSELVIPDEFNTWQVNDILSAKTCLCIDATNMNAVELSFDLKQTYSTFYLITLGNNIQRASSLRLLANGSQFSQTFIPFTHRNDPVRNHAFNLSEYAGSQFELCFESRNGIHPALDPFEIGDNAFIDNIKISENAVATEVLHEQLNSLSVVPNPFSDNAKIILENEWKGRLRLSIINTLGQTVFATEIEKFDRSVSFEFNAANLPTGIYRLLISNGEVIEVTTFLRQE